MDVVRQVKRFGKWIVEIIAIVLAETYLKPVIDLLTGQQITPDRQLLGVIGLIAIVIASILGVFLAQRIYKFWKAASHALRQQGPMPIPPSGSPIARPSSRILVEGQTFLDQDIYIDGHTWRQCTFRNCNIILERGDCDLISNRFYDCRLSARGGAIGVLLVAKAFFPSMPPILGPGGQPINQGDSGSGAT